MRKRVLRISVLCIIGLQASVAAQTVPPMRFYRQVSERVLAPVRISRQTEAILTFGLAEEEDSELQVQFPVAMRTDCFVSVRYVESGGAGISRQLQAIRKAEPDASVDRAAGLISLAHTTREIPCDGSLADLLRQAGQQSISIDASGDGFISVDTPYFGLNVLSGGLTLTAQIQFDSGKAVSVWAVRVREAIRSWMGQGFPVR